MRKRRKVRRIPTKLNNKKFLDRVLLIVALFLFIFTITMVVVFCIKDSVPDSLIVAVFGACTGEVSVCGWIKNVKERNNALISDDSIEKNGDDSV